MATDRRLRTDLLKVLGGVTPQRLSQLIAQVKRLHGPMTTEEGAYVLAHQHGLDLTKYLDRATVDRIRGMVPRDHALAPTAAAAATPAAKPRRPVSRPIRLSPTVPAVDLMLTTSVANDAERMADLYPRMYLLENSIRTVIARVLTARYGIDWWTTCAPSDVRRQVQGRKDKEAKVPWHGKRGSHDIYYSDFSDLKSIILKNWPDFAGILPSPQWISQKLEELEPARNTLAHHNPVPPNELKRIEVFFHDWSILIAAKRAAIP